MTPDQYRREGFRLGIEAAANEWQHVKVEGGRAMAALLAYEERIRAIDVDEVLAGLSPPAPDDAVALLLVPPIRRALLSRDMFPHNPQETCSTRPSKRWRPAMTNNLTAIRVQYSDGEYLDAYPGEACATILTLCDETERLRAENERLTAERVSLVKAAKDVGASFCKALDRAEKAEAERDEARATIEAYGREKVREGMQRAADIAEQCWESGYRYQTKEMILAAMETSHAS